MDKMTKAQGFVYRVIRDNPGVQNSDQRLVAAVWRAQGWTETRTLEDNLKHVMNSETITRSRRWLHEHGYITYTREALRQRMDNYKNHVEQYGSYDQARFFS